jgi:3-oxoacyl-[acyl-carrier protein] reductase
MDVADASSVAAWFAAREVPELLVCAAGVTRDGPLARMTEAEWDEVVAVNLSGAARCARAVVKGMCRRKSGHIVFISSHSALHPPVGQAAYAAAKAGLLGLAKSLARESGGFGVRVNAVLPGFLETRMTLGVPAGRRGEVLAEHVLGRFNGVAEVAGFVHFLHESLPHTSGQAFALDSRC